MKKIKIASSIILLTILSLSLNLYLNKLDKDQALRVVQSVDQVIDISSTESKITKTKVKELQDFYNNPDIKAILSLEGVDSFNYPVVQSTDNDYYLKHDYYKQYNTYGSIYADYRTNLDNSRKILIFGHSSIKREVPFNSLEAYYNEDYYNNHKYLTLETETETKRYEIFSVYVETNDFTYMNMLFNSDADWYSHILTLQAKSLYKTNVELNSNDDILIMQTCSTNTKYKKYSKKYLLIVSRRVK